MYKNRELKIMWLFAAPLTIGLNPKTQSRRLGTGDARCVAQFLAFLGAGGDVLFCFGFRLNDVGKAEQDKPAC